MNFARAILNKGFIIIAGHQVHHTKNITTIKVSNFIKKIIDKRLTAASAQIKQFTKFQSNLAQIDKLISSDELEVTPTSVRKNRQKQENFTAKGVFNVSAFSTAERYDLELLLRGLTQQNLYETKKFFSTDNLGQEADVLYVTAKYKVDEEPRDIFFFREGSIVLWNFNEIETNNILSFLRKYEKDGYLTPIVKVESEVMPYKYISTDNDGISGVAGGGGGNRAYFKNGTFLLNPNTDNFLQKYTFSNAMATSIKLGIWEATLDRFIDSIEYLTEDLKRGSRIRISRSDVLRKTGELFALRHRINLTSELLDIPDFYWDREDLEKLYSQVCSYFSISRRTKVLNTKINHCVELAELISHNLNDAHHIRLEWMIIILIMVEVAFEIIHYIDKVYIGHNIEQKSVSSQVSGSGSGSSSQHKQIQMNVVG